MFSYNLHAGFINSVLGLYSCRVPINSIFGFIIRTYKKVGSGGFMVSPTGYSGGWGDKRKTRHKDSHSQTPGTDTNKEMPRV